MAKVEYDEEIGYIFECPGCKEQHSFNVKPGPNGVGGQLPCWSFNDDINKPTFTPSLLVKWNYSVNREPRICHSFVTDGKIQFLNDCTHDLAGQTVELQEVDKA